MSFAERRRTLLSQGGGIKADPVLENNDWETISAVAQAGKAANFWKVGDRKFIKLKNFTNNYPSMPDLTNYGCYVKIIGFNHNESIEGKGIHFQFCLPFSISLGSNPDLAFVSDNYSKTGSSVDFRMNTTNTNAGGWKDSFMRNTICSIFFNQCLPDDLKVVIQPCTKYTLNSSSTVSATDDKLWLLAEYEVFGKNTHSSSAESSLRLKQYDYYKNLIANGKKPYRYKHDAPSYQSAWWFRSPYSKNTTAFCCVITDPGGGTSGGYAANYSFGFAPGFKV